jgi:hypothetical protein
MGDYLWLFYAGLSAVAAALVSIFGKIGLQGLDANTATTVRSVVMALFLIGVMIIQRNFSHLGEVLSNRRALLYIILSGTAGALSWLFYFVALKYGRVSQVAPVDKLSVVLAAVLAVVFLGESLSPLGLSGILLITAGVVCVAFG